MPAHLALETAAVELTDVTAGYGRSTVLRNIDLSVPSGTVTALLGPNGAGKTTLLRVVSGLVAVSAGDVHIAGKDMKHSSPTRRAKAGVCLVPEGRGVFPNLTVRENLSLFVPPWVKRATIDPAVEAFPALKDRLSQVAGTMSGGQQQMVALGRCFLAEPKVVLLDEVSMGLAPHVVDEIFLALEQLARSGVALLLVEQYVNRALAMADKVYLLDRGSVGFVGSPDELDEGEVMRRYMNVDPLSGTQGA